MSLAWSLVPARMRGGRAVGPVARSSNGCPVPASKERRRRLGRRQSGAVSRDDFEIWDGGALQYQWRPCASFTLALVELGQDQREHLTLVPCAVWGKHAEAASELEPGQLVLFEGKLARRKKGEQWELFVSGFDVTPIGAPPAYHDRQHELRTRKGDGMNLAYVEENAEYVATMEEAITRLTAAGHFLTTQALYAFVGQEVAGSYAQVAAFLKERGDAPQVDAFWDLRGRIGQWITQHGLEDESYKWRCIWRASPRRCAWRMTYTCWHDFRPWRRQARTRRHCESSTHGREAALYRTADE